MKSIKRRFEDLQERRPCSSTLINFGSAVRGGKFSARKIAYWFNRLVDRDDYCERDRRDLLRHFEALANVPEAGRKRG